MFGERFGLDLFYALNNLGEGQPLWEDKWTIKWLTAFAADPLLMNLNQIAYREHCGLLRHRTRLARYYPVSDMKHNMSVIRLSLWNIPSNT